ncbi:hypothetical protein K501DRAFT_278390 [Backusella circina FSU 941]|nr:hypothetical protein K501DRAFT_278390 [Backusella circina FSU 941]
MAHVKKSKGAMAQWIRRLTTNQEIPVLGFKDLVERERKVKINRWINQDLGYTYGRYECRRHNISVKDKKKKKVYDNVLGITLCIYLLGALRNRFHFRSPTQPKISLVKVDLN